MEKDSLDRIRSIFKDNFNDVEDRTLSDWTFSWHGYWYGAFGRTIIFTQNAVIDKFAADEHVYLKEADTFGTEDIAQVKRILKEDAYQRVVSHEPDHQTTTFTIVILTHSAISSPLAKAIRRFRCVKYYRLGLRGWSEANLVVINDADQEIVASKQARELGKVLKNTLWEAQ